MKTLIAAVALLAAGAAALPAYAQQYPSRPIRMLVGFAPGGGVDSGARLTASKLSALLGQPVVVENRPGAGSTLAASLVANAPADGYTLFYSGTSLLIAPALYKQMSFDPVSSFTAVGGVCWEQLVLAVTPSFPAKTTADLVKLMKADPGKYNYASPGVGTPHHLSMELFNKQAGIQAVHLPYKGAAPIFQDLIEGRVQVAMMSAAATAPQANAGRVRAIAVTRPVKIAIAPDWPAIADTLPGFESYSSHFIVAPAGTPAAVVGRLSEALKTALAVPETQQAFIQQGATAEYVPPETMNARIRSDVEKWGGIARESGATLD